MNAVKFAKYNTVFVHISVSWIWYWPEIVVLSFEQFLSILTLWGLAKQQKWRMTWINQTRSDSAELDHWMYFNNHLNGWSKKNKMIQGIWCVTISPNCFSVSTSPPCLHLHRAPGLIAPRGHFGHRTESHALHAPVVVSEEPQHLALQHLHLLDTEKGHNRWPGHVRRKA